jgi:hypothetical protein
MDADRAGRTLRRLTTPRAAALAGVLFAVLGGASILLMALLPRDPGAGTEWIRSGASQVRLALTLTPFAGIAFLWFIGVVRDRFGELEDRFFSTVLLGSGLLFLAMYFAAMSIAGGLVSSPVPDGPAYSVEVIRFGRSIMVQTFNVFALKMAGTFMISLGIMWLRTGLMPRWLAVVTWIGAAVLIVTVSQDLFLFLVFPGWVLLVSVVHLLRTSRGLVADAG